MSQFKEELELLKTRSGALYCCGHLKGSVLVGVA